MLTVTLAASLLEPQSVPQAVLSPLPLLVPLSAASSEAFPRSFGSEMSTAEPATPGM